jgi:serine phosphatase RsbU (regulator of sigma subunit)
VRMRLDESRGVFLLLVTYLGAFAAVDQLTPGDAIRLAPFTILAPFVAGALLSLRLTAATCVLCLSLIVIEYGFLVPGVSGPNKAIIIACGAAACVVSMVVCRTRLAREERTERLRITAEAAQRLLLRRLPLRSQDVEVDGFYFAAAREAMIGGDLYEVLGTPFGTRILIGDVRGKGLSAIGASSAVLTAFREGAYLERSLEAVIERMEDSLHRHNGLHERDLRDDELFEESETEERFVTALALEITDSETVRMIDCGHVPPLVIRDDEVVELPIDNPGLPLGLRSLLDERQRSQEIELPRGSRVLAITDGVSEVRGPDGEFYPLVDRLRRWSSLPTAQILRLLRTDLENYAEGALVDDAAALIVQR